VVFLACFFLVLLFTLGSCIELEQDKRLEEDACRSL
jgi:hypothetical protein